jgi:hypothetical protein
MLAGQVNGVQAALARPRLAPGACPAAWRYSLSCGWANGPGTEVDLGDQTGSERNAALMPGTRVVKAFNTLYARVTALDPRRAGGRLVVFLAGDAADAKATVSAFPDSMGFAPVDLGGLRAGRLMQVGGGPLSGLHVVKIA